MHSRKYNLITLVLAVLLIAQSAFPLVAQAQVTMVCKGPHATNAVCGRMIVPTSDLATGKAYSALMACCAKSDMSCGCSMQCGMMRGSSMSRSMPGKMAVQAKKTCTLVVTSIPIDSIAVLQSQHRLLTGSSPAVSTPALSSVVVNYPALQSITGSLDFVGPVFTPLVASHGLRAPPAV